MFSLVSKHTKTVERICGSKDALAHTGHGSEKALQSCRRGEFAWCVILVAQWGKKQPSHEQHRLGLLTISGKVLIDLI